MLRGEFREDLYYRLKVIEVTVPPLRERRSEIPQLTQFFIDRYARRYNRPVRQVSTGLQQLFQTYAWPGNIRELENMIKRLVILQDEELVMREMVRVPRVVAVSAPVYATVGAAAAATAPSASAVAVAEPIEAADVVDDEDAGDEADAGTAGIEAPAEAPGPSRLADIAKAAALKAERAVIKETLQQVQWNRRRAAGQLGVSYKTLLNKIKECGINPK